MPLMHVRIAPDLAPLVRKTVLIKFNGKLLPLKPSASSVVNAILRVYYDAKPPNEGHKK